MLLTETLATENIRRILCDETSGLPDEILSVIYNHKLFKLFVPEILGGLQLSLPDAMQILADCAYIDGVFGWCVQIGAGGGYFTEFLSAEIARDFISKPDFVIAGSGFPGGTAIWEGNGFHIKNGYWKYCSGSQYATLFTANCRLGDSDEIKAFAFRPEQVKIIPNWDSYGIQASSSDAMQVESLFLPDKMSFSIYKPQVDYGYPLHRFPFLSFAEVVISATLYGCFLRLMENAKEIAGKNNSGALKEEIARAKNMSAGLWEKLGLLVNDTWEKAMQNGLQEEGFLLAELSEHIKNTTRLLFNSASNLFFLGGMQATCLHHPFNKTWRDFTTICQHALLKQ